MPQVILILKFEMSKLAVNPACTGLHEAIIAVELWEHELLQHLLGVGHVLLRVGHVLRE